MTSRIAEFSFLGTASHVDRVQYAGGALDPWNGARPFAIYSANTLQYESNSTFATIAGFTPAITSMHFPTPNSGTVPCSNNWMLGPSATCSNGCAGVLTRGNTAAAQTDELGARSWAIFTSA